MTPQDSTRFSAPGFHIVTDARQAQLLTEPKSKAFFKPFLAVEHSAAEAAAELGCQLNTVLYRVKTFLEAGLLEVTRTQKRKGRAVKYYRSCHDAYFVPFTLTPYATLEERLEVQAEPIFGDLIRSYASALRQHERYGNYLFRSGEEVVTTDAVPELLPSGWPVLYSDTVVGLSKTEAVALAEALRALFRRGVGTEQTRDVEARDYFFMVALLPLAR